MLVTGVLDRLGAARDQPVFGLSRGGRRSLLLDTELTIASFGEDEAGELYVLDLSEGAVYRIAGTAS